MPDETPLESAPEDELAPGTGDEATSDEWNMDLPAQLQDILKETVKAFQAQETYERRNEILRDRKNRFYARGQQHWYFNENTGTFTKSVAGSVVNAGGNAVQTPDYIDDYNIFYPYLRILTSILTQNPPGIDFQPMNPALAEDMEAAETAEGYRKMFDRSNDIKKIQRGIVRMMGLSGRTIVWTRSEANAQKFGRNPDGSPRQMELATVHGTLESKVPILSKDIGECLYVFLKDDPNIRCVKSEYPEIADKIKNGMDGIGDDSYERIARLGVMQGSKSQSSSEAFSHLIPRMHCWLRPASFTGESYEEAFEEGDDQTIQEKLQELFPDGVLVRFVGDVYAGARAESMDDALDIGFPDEGDGMNRPSMMEPMIPVQDTFNDQMNVAREVFDYGWPSTWVNADDEDYAEIVNQSADPYAIRQIKVKGGQGASTESMFYREPNPELPETFLQYVENLQGPLSQFILATPPALFGASMEDQKTASGYNQARAQAMGQLGLAWQSVQRLMARMYYQAALCASKNPDHSEEIVIATENGPNGSVVMDRLRKGKFGAFPDEDSSFPESMSAKRSVLQTLLPMAMQSPIGAQILQSPDNWELIKQTFGVPELQLQEAASRNKQIREIETLLVQSPLPPDPEAVLQALQQHAAATIVAEQTGQPAPPDIDPTSLMQPSVGVDELDFHEYEAAKGKEWLSSTECWKQIASGNQAGVLNVKLHTLAHMKMIPPPMPMLPPAGAPAPHGAPGKPAAPPANLNAPPGAPAAPTM